jgi:hypothetical protein
VSAIVLIASTEALADLRKQLATENVVRTFTDHEVRQAVEYIATARPAVVALDEDFAASARGEALVGRIMDDPSLKGCAIRVLHREPEADAHLAQVVAALPVAIEQPVAHSMPALPVAGGVEANPPLDHRGTRRAPRVRLVVGIEVTVDGNAAELVDLSANGAQVLSKIILRPNQRVRIALSEDRRSLRCAGVVVWASFEMPPGHPPRYRAGLKLSGIEAEALQHFAERHQEPGSGKLG